MGEQINDVNVGKFKELDGMMRANPALTKATFKLKSTWRRGTKTLVEVGGGKVTIVDDPVFAGANGGLAIALDADESDWEKLSA